MDELQEIAAQCRHLIRNIATPGRLRTNALAQTILARMTRHEAPPRVLEMAVDEALSHLPLRDRKIVVRCDSDCEEIRRNQNSQIRFLHALRRNAAVSQFRLSSSL